MTNIYVGNLPVTASEEDIRTLFEQHGKVTSAHLVVDQYTGKFRGFGIVAMENRTEALAAINALDGFNFAEKNLQVYEPRPRTPKGTRGGVTKKRW